MLKVVEWGGGEDNKIESSEGWNGVVVVAFICLQ